jgi:ABC-type antimicrobial peptide transport system permease subunit
LVRQFLIESLMLAFAGGICGIALAWIGTSTVAAIAPREIPRIEALKSTAPRCCLDSRPASLRQSSSDSRPL